ncbi:MAG: hypothetical protein CMM39_05080 [Rhodospirillaceae bacterium]|nr:hypothetical protein [Rhodospirillaceae bacterium]MDG1885562.1 hypothetical protein [Alphaproteobacteria bacterium]|tara:strand:- start:260 stop:442 length:183 start_codon:yes stop_codon:yes gene_type:complete
MAIKTNYKFEKMERDRLKAEKKKKRLEEKRMNQSNNENGLEDSSSESQPSDELENETSNG